MTPEQFYNLLSNDDLILEFLRNNNIIPPLNTQTCEKCTSILKDRQRKRKDGDTSFILRCHKCKFEKSALSGTFFATNKINGVSQKLSVTKILKMVYNYMEKKNYEEIQNNTGIKCVKTIVNWANYIREVMVTDRMSRNKIGGVGVRVQIDESLFRGRRKYHRGRLLLGDLDIETSEDSFSRRRNYGERINGPWIFGMVEENSNKLVMFNVEKRNEETLLPLILNHIEIGTTIVSDGWPAYRNLPNYGYVHEVVIHEENFIDPITGANTQRIECEWGHAKFLILKLKRGTTMQLLQSHLDEYCFRKLYKENLFIEWLKKSNYFN